MHLISVPVAGPRCKLELQGLTVSPWFLAEDFFFSPSDCMIFGIPQDSSSHGMLLVSLQLWGYSYFSWNSLATHTQNSECCELGRKEADWDWAWTESIFQNILFNLPFKRRYECGRVNVFRFWHKFCLYLLEYFTVCHVFWEKLISPQWIGDDCMAFEHTWTSSSTLWSQLDQEIVQREAGGQLSCHGRDTRQLDRILRQLLGIGWLCLAKISLHEHERDRHTLGKDGHKRTSLAVSCYQGFMVLVWT